MSRTSTQASLAVEYLAQERTRFAEQRRKVFIIVGLIGILLLLYNIYVYIMGEEPYRSLYVINDALFAGVALILVILGYTRKFHIDVLERAVFVLMALESFIFCSLAPYLFGFDLERIFTETVVNDVWLLILVCALALHIFGPMLAAGFYSVSLALMGLYLLTHLSDGPRLASLTLQTYLAGGMVVCFIYVLARYRNSVQRISVQYEMLEQVAFMDALTGLPNRRRMYDVLQQQLELLGRYGTPFCIALLDIDHFKRINDTFGHLKGDEVLVQVTNTLRTGLRTTDQLGRWGGEEFLLVLPQIELPDAVAALERSRQAVERSITIDGQAVTLSCGVTACFVGDDIKTLVQRADDALYKAKETGRNKVVSSEEQEVGGRM